MNIKRKNDDFPLSIYDQTWLFGLYRWLRWDRVRSIHVDQSPEIVRQQIEWFTEDKSLHRVKTQTVNSPYAFQACVFSSSERKSSERGLVNGQVIAVPEQDKKSLIVLHAYPSRANTGVATFFTVINLLVIGGAITTNPSLAIVLILLMYLVLSPIPMWVYVLLSRNEALEAITKRFTPIASQNPEKAKREDSR